MAEGELGAVFKGLAKDAADAAETISESVAKVSEQAADLEEANLARIFETDAKAADDLAAIGRKGTADGPGTAAGTSLTGPPWRVADDVPGAARGKVLNPPNPRHTVAGARNGMVKPENSVILRGNEQAVRDDVAQIAEGKASWNPQTQRYEINGRSYAVEPSGTVFPDSGPGIVKLDRNEYAALKELARAGGDPSKVPAFTHDPRFTTNPEAIAKAKAIYDGTYSP